MLRTLNWLFRALLFFILFAFALNNQHVVQLKWFMGYQWEAPMVFVVLAVFVLGCVAGVLAMVPSWWRHRRDARQRAHLQPEPQAPVQAGKGLPTGDASAAGPATLPAELPFPPDMPAPRKPAR
ncbi:lipopolysaccharide assembly protein LapA domain-containing protein [uncultured Aquabacterium sp.]|uniref:LapA family protein n=1 Tax=Aquabacterium sp. TaxID=1872578 RepID=UPI003458A0F9